MTHKEYAKGLRAVARWYERAAQKAVPLPYTVSADEGLSFNLCDKVEIATVIRVFRGGWDRTENYGLVYFIRRERFEGFKVRVYTNRRTVCEAVVVGQKVIPAVPLHVVPASPERTEDVIEWQCKSVLAGENTV